MLLVDLKIEIRLGEVSYGLSGFAVFTGFSARLTVDV